MKVILRQDVSNLGMMGEIINVKDGYARNFLIPRELVYFASDSAMNRLEAEKRQYYKRQALEKSQAEEISEKLSELQVSIPMKVGEEGRLFGSVTPQMISQELGLRGYEIDRRNIIIENPIKSLGVFDIKVKLYTDVITTLKVWVIGEE